MITSLTNKKIKNLVQLAEKAKYRNQQDVFLVEGSKMFWEAKEEEVKEVYVTELFLKKAEEQGKLREKLEKTGYEIVTEEVFKKISATITPQGILAVVKQSHYELEQLCKKDNPLLFLLEDIQDPGNLGTIIRIADWFGIHQIIASHDTVDVFNPKTIQATMGAISRVKVIYTDLKALIETYSNLPIYGTLLEGENIYEKSLKSPAFIIMGNEGKGITPAIRELISEGLFIPSYPGDVETSESLNVGVATAITIAEFRRQEIVSKNVK